MTTYDRNMLAKEALAVLYRDGGTGQAPEAEDVEYVDDRIDAVLEELRERNIVSISDPEDIEPKFFFALAECVAFACANHFRKPKDLAAKADAEHRLEVMVNNSPATSPTLKVEAALLPAVPGLSLARWTRGG